MLGKNKNHSLKGGLAKRMIFAILLFSSIITLLGTSFQLYLDYTQDVNAIEAAMDQIERSYLETIENNLWVADLEQLEIQLQGIIDLPGMQYLEISKNNKVVLAVGDRPFERVVTRTYPLDYMFKGKNVDLGVLTALADLDAVYQRLSQKVFVILSTQAIKTFLVSFFIFLLFYLLVGRHLENLARYAKGLTIDSLGGAVKLQRKKKIGALPDELDTVVEAMNEMSLNLAKDMETRLQTEKALRESEELLRAIIGGTSDAIFLKDLDGRYVLANESTAVAIGKPQQEVIGKTDRELFPPESAEVIEAVDSRVISSGKPVLAEENLKTTHGSSSWLTNKSPLLGEEGQIRGVIGISRDISAIKKIEEEKRLLKEQLAQAQKMEAIGTLAGGIAHDFNNILAIIIGYSEIIKDDVQTNEELLQNIDMVIEASCRAKDLVQQILAFSRQTDVERIPIQLQPLVKEALKILRPTIPATIEIREEIDPDCGVVLVDPTQVHQILMNLCSNAHHAMEKSGGILGISLKRTILSKGDELLPLNPRSGEYAELKVSDTGVGIGPDIIDRIFDPYYTTKGVGKGTGMGLAIIHGIITGYGGSITVESEPGKGAVFHVYFPVVEEKQRETIQDFEDIPHGNGRILLVDDEESLVTLGKRMLERLGYSVVTCRSSLEAFELFRNNPENFDVVVTDQTMPGITGAELATKLLQIRPDISIILCTGYSSLVDEESAKQLGIKAFVRKPFDKGTMAKLLKNALKN